jgi:hypothetical protein
MCSLALGAANADSVGTNARNEHKRKRSKYQQSSVKVQRFIHHRNKFDKPLG